MGISIGIVGVSVGAEHIDARSSHVYPRTVVGETGADSVDIGSTDIHYPRFVAEKVRATGVAVASRVYHHHIMRQEVVNRRVEPARVG